MIASARIQDEKEKNQRQTSLTSFELLSRFDCSLLKIKCNLKVKKKRFADASEDPSWSLLVFFLNS